MRTSIYFKRDENGHWKCGDDDPRIDVSHDAPLTEEDIEAFRALARLVAAKTPEHGRSDPGVRPLDDGRVA